MHLAGHQWQDCDSGRGACTPVLLRDRAGEAALLSLDGALLAGRDGGRVAAGDGPLPTFSLSGRAGAALRSGLHIPNARHDMSNIPGRGFQRCCDGAARYAVKALLTCPSCVMCKEQTGHYACSSFVDGDVGCRMQVTGCQKSP